MFNELQDQGTENYLSLFCLQNRDDVYLLQIKMTLYNKNNNNFKSRMRYKSWLHHPKPVWPWASQLLRIGWRLSTEDWPGPRSSKGRKRKFCFSVATWFWSSETGKHKLNAGWTYRELFLTKVYVFNTIVL